MADMIDMLATEPHFIDHLAPVWHALPEDDRGDFIVPASARAPLGRESLPARAIRRRIEPSRNPTDSSRPILVTSYGDHKVARKRLGRRRIIRMEHGIGQSFEGSDHESYAGGIDAHDVGLFLTPNEHSANRWRKAYPKAVVEVVGCPKVDTLPTREGEPNRMVAISFHWSASLSRGSALIESSGSFDEYRASTEHLAQHFRVIGHGHPRVIDKFATHYRRAGIRLVPDFEDVCRQADVYVCDTNSTIYEFASTGRPVVVVNGKHFRRDRKHGLRFDWGPITNVGVQCDHPSELVAAVEEALRDEPKWQKARETALGMVYAYRGDSAQRAAEAVLAWAGERRVRRAA